MSMRESTKSTWMDVTNESVHTSDDVDIGDIEAINRNFLVVKRDSSMCITTTSRLPRLKDGTAVLYGSNYH